jgi:hypothetical protein
MRYVKILTLVVAIAAAFNFESHAAVEKAAFLQGSELEGGVPFLTSAAPISIAWNERSSIDPRVFEHDVRTPHQLKVLEDGDYIALATMPVISFDTPDNRPSQGIEIFVNGEPAPGSMGQSGYIRNQPRNSNMQNETSCHAHLLLPGLSAGDIIELRAYKTAQPAINVQIQTASLLVEKAEDSTKLFSAVTDDSLAGVNLNPDFEGAGEDPVQLVWQSNRKDSNFAHSEGSSSISLGKGLYVVYVNVPLQRRSSSRLSPSLEILLDGQIVSGGQARQGYNRNASGHIESSVHFSGIIEVAGNEQNLDVQMLRYGNSGNTGNATLPDGKKASILLEKVSSSVAFLSTGSETTDADDPTNWNTATKEQIVWETPVNADSSVYAHNGESLTLKKAGDYLLTYNDTLQSSAARPNPRITVEINGQPYPGAETKSHYIRNANGHNTSSTALAILLEGLSANDVVTVSTQREGQTGHVGIEEFSNEAAILGLVLKNSLDPTGIAAAPRIVSFAGDANGFSINLQEFNQSVDLETIQVSLNGNPVEVVSDQSGGMLSVNHVFESVPDSMSSHAVQLEYKDNAGGAHVADLNFTVNAVYSKLPASFANGSVDSSSSGFVANVSQISTAQTGVNHVHGNTIGGAESQLSGTLTDADGNHYINEAASEGASTWELNAANLSLINLEQDAGSAGNFNADNGHPDDLVPNIPGINDSNDGIAAEFLTYLELEEGWHTLGVNSDDGFQLSSGPSTKDLLAQGLGEFNSSRGSADTIFDIYVETAGVYPMRLLWFEGNGGANVEFFSVVEGEKILVNDRDHPKAIKAYSKAKSRPYVSSFTPDSGVLSDEVSFTVTHGDIRVVQDSLQLTIDGMLVIPPNIDADAKTITTSYKRPTPFDGGEHVSTLTYMEDSDPQVTRTVEYRFSVPKGMHSVINDGAFAYFQLGETAGGQAINAMGDTHKGTYQNGPEFGQERLAVGAKSASVLFDKEQQHGMTLINHTDINVWAGNPGWTEKTIEFWFKARNLPNASPHMEGAPISQRQVIYEQGGATRGINVYLEGTQEGDNPSEAKLWFNILNRAEATPWGGTLPFNETEGVGTDRDAIALGTTIQADTVYHAVMVFQSVREDGDLSGIITGYLNGESFGEASGANILFNHSDGIAIGRRNNEVSFHDLIINSGGTPDLFSSADQFNYDGWLDEFALYNVPLTADQVKAHYEAGNAEVAFTPEPVDPVSSGGQVHSIALSGGNVVIEFEGNLKSSATAAGPYAPVAGAVSPFTATADQSTQFYIAE